MENSTLKKQICTIEQAKKLKELGLKQRTLFFYVNNWLNPRKLEINDGEYVIVSEEKHLTRKKGRERGTEVEFCSAYTETELKAFMPYGKVAKNLTVIQFANYLIELLENEITFTVEECNLNYLEFFDIDETIHEL